MTYGSKPVDGGNLILTKIQKLEYLQVEPNGGKYIRPFIGSEELINGNGRYCFWLIDANPQELRKLPELIKHIDAVRQMRLESTKIPT